MSNTSCRWAGRLSILFWRCRALRGERVTLYVAVDRLLIDFGKPPRQSRLPRLHRHGHADMQVIGALLAASGFEISNVGAVGTKNLNYIRAKSCGPGNMSGNQ
jgi:hypothetical protein